MFAVVFVRGVRSSLLGAHVVGLEGSVERVTQEGGPRKRCGVSIIREPLMNRGLRTPARSAGWAPSFSLEAFAGLRPPGLSDNPQH